MAPVEVRGLTAADLPDLTREVATDLYLRRYSASIRVPMRYAEALTVAAD